jgi:hypothetical protein
MRMEEITRTRRQASDNGNGPITASTWRPAVEGADHAALTRLRPEATRLRSRTSDLDGAPWSAAERDAASRPSTSEPLRVEPDLDDRVRAESGRALHVPNESPRHDFPSACCIAEWTPPVSPGVWPLVP